MLGPRTFSVLLLAGALVAGMSLTYDEQLVFVTELGNLFVISPDADPNDLGDIPVISSNQGCRTAEPDDLELVSNSLAADEDGGIDEAIVASAAALESLDAAVAALDAGEPHDVYVDAAREALSAL